MRAPTAYFLFAGEVRQQVFKEAQDENNGKASVAIVGKKIGQLWAQLTDDDKQKYKDLAAKKAQELKEQQEKEREEARAAGGDDKDPANEPTTTTKSAPPPPPFGLPTSLVKKIATMDPDVDRMTADAVRAISKAATLFIEMLAEQALDNAKHMKRKNFKFSDIEETARLDRRLVDMGLTELLENDSVFAEVHGKVEEENKNRQANKLAAQKEKDAGKGMKAITSFFGGGGGGGGSASKNKNNPDDNPSTSKQGSPQQSAEPIAVESGEEEEEEQGAVMAEEGSEQQQQQQQDDKVDNIDSDEEDADNDDDMEQDDDDEL